MTPTDLARVANDAYAVTGTVLGMAAALTAQQIGCSLESSGDVVCYHDHTSTILHQAPLGYWTAIPTAPIQVGTAYYGGTR